MRNTVKNPRPATRAAALAFKIQKTGRELADMALELLAIVGAGMDASRGKPDASRKKKRAKKERAESTPGAAR